MFALTLAVALTCQTPTKPLPARPQATTAKTYVNPTLAKRAAKKAALSRYHAARIAEERLQASSAQAQAERLLPLQLEAQRQALQRQSELERNMALQGAVGAMQRMANAAERRSGYITTANSPAPAPPPIQIAPHYQGGW